MHSAPCAWFPVLSPHGHGTLGTPSAPFTYAHLAGQLEGVHGWFVGPTGRVPQKGPHPDRAWATLAGCQQHVSGPVVTFYQGGKAGPSVRAPLLLHPDS